MTGSDIEVAQPAPASGSTWRRIADFTAPILLLLAPFLNFVLSNQYQLLSMEVWRIILALLLFGAGIGWLVSRLRGPWQAMLIAVLITVFVDLQSPNSKLTWLLMALFVSYFLVRILQRHITVIVSTMALAVVISTMLFPNRLAIYDEFGNSIPNEQLDETLPPVIHLILDEYIGVEGLPRDNDWSGELIPEIKTAFIEAGFRLNGGAYSQYFNTYNAIGNMLNFSVRSLDAAYFDEIREPYTLKENAYFRSLADRGYRFRIYQSAFINYCDDSNVEIDACFTYKTQSIKFIENLPLDVLEKTGFIWRSYIRMSALRRITRALYNRSRKLSPFSGAWLPYWGSKITSVGPLPAMPVLDIITKDVAKSAGGQIFFAHLLLPHSAYILNDDCDVRMSIDEWRVRSIFDRQSDQANTAESRKRTYSAYAQQLRCTNRLLTKFFAGLRDAGRFDNATIIIHSDHGSRINRNWPTVKNREKLVVSDFTDGFPTLFAVKAPGIEADYVSNRETLPSLLADVLGAPEIAPHERGIYLFDGRGKEMTLTKMPAAWLE